MKIEIIKRTYSPSNIWYHVLVDSISQKAKRTFEEAKEYADSIPVPPTEETVYTKEIKS